jgi:hypothetical protein
MPLSIARRFQFPVVRISALAFAAALAVGGIAFAASAPPNVVVKLEPQPGSKIAGTATISHVSMDPPLVDVTIVLDGVFIPENLYPAGVYNATCANLGPTPEYRLTPVMGGRSKTRVKPTAMKPGPYVVAVFDTAGTHAISCGALPMRHHRRSPTRRRAAF